MTGQECVKRFGAMLINGSIIDRRCHVATIEGLL